MYACGTCHQSQGLLLDTRWLPLLAAALVFCIFTYLMLRLLLLPCCACSAAPAAAAAAGVWCWTAGICQ
jgi:hypothetical protein